jgi:hypothetical protein
MVALALVFACLANSDFRQAGYYPLLLLFYLVVPWRALGWPMRIAWLLAPACAWLLLQLPPVAAYTLGGMSGSFGTGYAAIGWHKFLRNLVNIPVVLLVGLGLPAFLCLGPGLRELWHQRERLHGWQYLLPLALFLLYMALLAPVTYYRHYLVLIPGATLLAAIGYWSLPGASRPLWLALFLLWPAVLALDLNLDYHRDPRIELRDWYAARQPQRVLVSYYVNPPVAPAARHRLFRPEYAAGDAAVLRSAQYLVLSENWYDTAFANELNGPLVNDLNKLIKTRPEYARFYRRALAGNHPWLAPERHIATTNFMPELVLHKALYGSFQMFVGDIVVLRVRESLR